MAEQDQEHWSTGDVDDISADEEITDWRVSLLVDGHERGAIYDTDREAAAARAGRVVRAVNAHDDLLAVCDALLRWYHDPHALAITDVVALAEDAIAKARPAPEP